MGSVKKIFGVILVILVLSTFNGQGQGLPDSLIVELGRTYDKERRLEILLEITKLTRHSFSDTALYFARRQLDLAKIVENKKMYARALFTIGRIHKDVGELKNAAAFLFEAYDEYRLLNDDLMSGVTLYNLGQMFASGNDYQNGILYLRKALKQYESINDVKRQAFAHYEIARCYTKMSSYTESLLHLKRCLILDKNILIPSFTSKIHNYFGINYYNLKLFDKAIESYLEAKDCAIGLPDYDKKSAIAYNNIGEVYVEKRNLEDARLYFEKALEIKRQLNDRELLAGTLINLGKLALLENQPAKAISYLEEILNILDKNRLSDNLNEASLLLAEAYKSKQNLTDEDLQKVIELNAQYAQHIHALKQTGFQQSMISTISQNALESETLYLEKKVEKVRKFSVWIIVLSLAAITGFLILLHHRKRKFKLFIYRMWEDIKDV